MIYPIYIYGSPVLRTETLPITEFSPEIKQLIADMFETMYQAEGVGLAAPQIGKSLRLFVVDAEPFAEDDPGAAGFKRAFVNPEIYERSGEPVVFNEGCLSLPGIHENVWRNPVIRIRYRDENFLEHDEQLSGMAARIVQHEYDHVEGMVFTDHLQPLRKTLIKNKLNALSKGKYRAGYKTRTENKR